MIKYLFMAFLLMPVVAVANPYQVDYEASQIQFSGTHAGNEFTGVFNDWDADINFNTQNTDKSFANVTLSVASAHTGNAMYDGTLPSADWFNVGNYPTASFKSTSFQKSNDGYNVIGELTIRDVTIPMTFNFKLNGENPIIMTANLPINRLKFNIGKDSDGNAEWVSEIINIDMTLHANKI